MTTLKQQQLQRKYLETITSLALAHVLQKDPSSLHFDPQGRVLVDVTLLSKEEKRLFTEAFGETRSPTLITTVSLDVTQISELNDAYKHRYGLDTLNEKQLAAFSAVRGSIIPLQQEFYFHLALAARTYTKVDESRFSKEKMDRAHQAAMKRIHPLIQKAFKEALEKAKSDGALNDVTLVQELDKARKRISAQAHSILMEEVIKETGQSLSKDDLKTIKNNHLAEKITASPNDLVHTDQSLEQIIWISGSENTAHKRLTQQDGADVLADRQIVTFAHNEKQQPRLQIRTPSLDVKENISMSDAINDVHKKLSTLTKKYSMNECIAENPLGRKAFTYNLHTAINHTLDDWFKENKQSWGARVILSGAHLYNKEQFKSQTPKPPLCLVQNLSVNGFGASLGYRWNIGWNKLINEATLMAEMAMLQNLVDSKDSLLEIQKVFKLYEQFLKNAKSQGEHYFCRSEEGQQAIEQIKAIKKGWAAQQEGRMHQVETPVDKAKDALKTIMANNLHHTHEYSKLVQSLSLFIEDASIAGCKSGNERAQAINGRVAILDHEAGEPKSTIFKAIDALAKAEPNEVKRLASDLKRHLDGKYDKHLQTGLSLISDVDQGASAKCNAKTSWMQFWTKFNPNYAEESSLTHLSQTKSGNMQAHKGLTESMAVACGYSKSFSSYLGKAGIILSVVTLPISLLVVAGIYQFSYKPYKEELNATAEPRIKACKQIYAERMQEKAQKKVGSYEMASNQLDEFQVVEPNAVSEYSYASVFIVPKKSSNVPARLSDQTDGKKQALVR